MSNQGSNPSRVEEGEVIMEVRQEPGNRVRFVNEGAAGAAIAEAVHAPANMEQQEVVEEYEQIQIRLLQRRMAESLRAFEAVIDRQNEGGSGLPLEDNVPLNFDIKFDEIANPAPDGNECIIYLARNVYLYTKDFQMDADSADKFGYIYHGELKGDKELFHWDFTLSRRAEKEFYDMAFFDMLNGPMNLTRFRQAEFLLQFFMINRDSTTTLIHEEPPHQVSLERAHFKFQKNLHRSKPRHLSFEGILPAMPFEEMVMKSRRAPVLMRIHAKLMKGEVNVQHGIQKCFQPDKAVFDLQGKMGSMLADGDAVNADLILVCKEGKKRYRAHRAVLAAHSDVFKAMFLSGMKESKAKEVNFDARGAVLEAFLKFIYTRNRHDLESDPNLTIDVWKAADMYHVELLKEVCEESVLAMPLEVFTLDSALWVFYQAATVGSLALQTKSVQIIMRFGNDFNDCKTYTELMKSNSDVVTKLTAMIIQFTNADQ